MLDGNCIRMMIGSIEDVIHCIYDVCVRTHIKPLVEMVNVSLTMALVGS